MRCDVRNYVSPHSSVRIGGFCMGQCEKEALTKEGLTVCFEHAHKETLLMVIHSLQQEIEKLKGKKKTKK